MLFLGAFHVFIFSNLSKITTDDSVLCFYCPAIFVGCVDPAVHNLSEPRTSHRIAHCAKSPEGNGNLLCRVKLPSRFPMCLPHILVRRFSSNVSPVHWSPVLSFSSMSIIPLKDKFLFSSRGSILQWQKIREMSVVHCRGSPTDQEVSVAVLSTPSLWGSRVERGIAQRKVVTRQRIHRSGRFIASDNGGFL